jgi:TRAP-type C4-dicarboxylate transport system permease small subunit
MKDNIGQHKQSPGILDRLVRITQSVICGFLTILLIAMALILGASIVMRFFLDQPIVWSNTITRYAYIYIVLLGTAISYIEGSHAQIEVLYERVPQKIKIVFDLLHYGVMIFLCLVLTIMGTKHVMTMWHVNSPILAGFPLGAVYLAVPLCAIVMMIYIFQQLAGLKDRKEA